MRYSDILLHLTQDHRSVEKFDLALTLARKFKASVTALYTIPYPMPAYYMGEFVPPEFYQQISDETKASAAKTKAAFEEAVAKADVAARWVEAELDPESAIRSLGRTCDIVIAGQSDPDAALDAGLPIGPGDLALSLGRPVLAVPYVGHFPAIGKKVTIAWNGSREATRAVHDALPLLQDAKSVDILTVNPTPEISASATSLSQHLIHYGMPARVNKTVVQDIEDGEAILSTLADAGSDLLVMGVFGHSRLQEMILGGTSRTILNSMTTPVLLSS
jgi:nucleotide-binding universal stress UspA family protein